MTKRNGILLPTLIFFSSFLLFGHGGYVPNYNVYSGSANSSGPGTTPGLRETFIGRCWEYQSLINPPGLSAFKNCTDLWQLFSQAFTYKSPCQMNSSDYGPFLDEAQHPVATNQIVFWEGTYALTHQYTDNGRRKTAIANTLSGFLVDGMLWCGQPEHPGINYDKCPAYGECIPKTSYDNLYWIPASKRFASLAKGVATVILNGTRLDGRKTAAGDSVFAKYELTNLDPKEVTLLQAYVMHDIGVTHKESCGNGSLIGLKNRTEELGINFQCLDDPAELVHLLCVDKPGYKPCQLNMKQITSVATPVTTLSIPLFIFHLVLLL